MSPAGTADDRVEVGAVVIQEAPVVEDLRHLGDVLVEQPQRRGFVSLSPAVRSFTCAQVVEVEVAAVGRPTFSSLYRPSSRCRVGAMGRSAVMIVSRCSPSPRSAK
jgi:hypothetical protein